MALLTDSENSYVIPTEQSKKLTIDGQTDVYKIYKVRLDQLYYNDKNDRIATWINKHESEKGPIDRSNLEEYNRILEGYIHDSDPESMRVTKNSIFQFKQREPGVVLPDGRVIDGNRRFTCLRELYREGHMEFGYFETVILKGITNPSDKRIKILELNIQLATDKPVDYNPVDRMYAAYRDIVENKLFDIKDYARETNMKPSDVKLMIKKATLMNEFLEFLGTPNQYYIAREMKLDGPLQEAVGALEKCRTETEREEMKSVIFAHMIVNPAGDQEDLTRHIRKFKKIAGTDESKEFISSQETVLEEVIESIDKQCSGGSKPVIEVIRDIRKDSNITGELHDQTSRAIKVVSTNFARDVPLMDSKSALEILQGIRLNMVEKMEPANKQTFMSTLNAIEREVKRLRDGTN